MLAHDEKAAKLYLYTVLIIKTVCISAETKRCIADNAIFNSIAPLFLESLLTRQR